MPDGALEFLLKLDAQVDGALRMIRAASGAEEALKKLDKTSSGAEKKLKELGKEAEKGEGVFKRFTKAGLEPFAEKLKSIGEFEFIRRGVDALIELPEKLIDVVKELGEEILIASGKAQEARITFGALFGGEDGNKLIEYSDALGEKTAFINDEWKSIERTLGNAGVKVGTQMDHATALVSDLAALGGGGAGAANYATDLVARMRNLGEISARQLVGFGLNQKDFWTELSRQTGTGVATLKKRVGEGKVDVEALEATVEQLVTRKTGKKLGGLGADIGEDFLSRVKRLQHVPELLFETFEKSPGFAHVSAFVDKLTAAFDPKSALGQRLIEDLDKVGKFLQGIDLDKLVGTLERVASILERVIALTGKFGAPAVSAGLPVAANALGAGGAGKAVATNAAIAGTIITAPISVPTLAIGYGLKKLGASLFGGGAAAGQGFALGVRGELSAADAAGRALGDTVDRATRKRLGVHSPSTVFEDTGAQSALGYRQGLERGLGKIPDSIWNAVSGPDLDKAMREDGALLSAEARNALSITKSGGSASGRPVINLSVTVPISGGQGADARALADEVRDRLREVLPSELAAALEQVVIEAGA